MVRTQVQFEEGQYEEIRRRAFEQRASFSATVRRLVDQGLAAGAPADKKPRAEALLKLSGIARSGLGDLGRRHDDYFAEDAEK